MRKPIFITLLNDEYDGDSIEMLKKNLHQFNKDYNVFIMSGINDRKASKVSFWCSESHASPQERERMERLIMENVDKITPV